MLDVPAATSTPQARIETKSVTKAEPEAKTEPEAKRETKGALMSEAQADPKAEPKPEAKAAPEAESDAKSEGNAAPEPESGTNPKAGSKPETMVAPEPLASRDIAALLKTPLGDVLMSGLLKNPEDAGHLIAQGIMQIEARIAATNTHEAAPEPEAKAETPPALTPKAAE